jgi:protein-disulfide isomerase
MDHARERQLAAIRSAVERLAIHPRYDAATKSVWRTFLQARHSSDMPENTPENPRPIRPLGQPDIPAEPYSEVRPGTPEVVDADLDLFGAEAAAARLAERLQSDEPHQVRFTGDGRALLAPPFAPARDRVDGYVSATTTVVVFGAFGTPWSRRLGEVLARVRDDHHSSARIAWRHYPDPVAHPRAAVLALASEVAAVHGRFWVLTRRLLSMSHDDPADFHAALLHSGLDPERVLAEMRAGTGTERIADDVASARASGVTSAPALFLDGERYSGDLDPTAISRTLDERGAP